MTLNMEPNQYPTIKPGAMIVKNLLAKIKNDGYRRAAFVLLVLYGIGRVLEVIRPNKKQEETP
jgi:hypothetical protein